ncbi:MAG: YfcC family protein [Anaerovoracaceae bacterium]
MEKKEKKTWSPNPYVLLLIIILICAIATWIIPAGSFERVFDEELERNLVEPGSFEYIESTPVGITGFLESIFNGFVDAADIIFFILFAAAYVNVLSTKGALNALTGLMLRKLGNKDVFVIPAFMLLFGLGGTTFGMFEETYALIPAFIVIAIALGYDRVVGGAIVFVGVATGFAAATLNPFTIGVASAVAEVDLVTPKLLVFRIVCFVLFEALAITYTMRYANKIRKDPTKSVMYGDPNALVGMDNMGSKEEIINSEFTLQHKISLLGFVALIVILVLGIILRGWYLTEIATLFLVFMVFTCIVYKLKSNEIADMFVAGAKSALFGALLVGMARGVSVVMTEGNIIDTCVNALANIVSQLPKSVNAVGMIIVQNLVNFFIPSGSGQAVVTMPILAPVADLIGQSREIAVLAFQFGDGFSNMFWPTSVATECGIMGIGLNKWYKFITPLFGMMVLLQCIMICVAVFIGI